MLVHLRTKARTAASLIEWGSEKRSLFKARLLIASFRCYGPFRYVQCRASTLNLARWRRTAGSFVLAVHLVATNARSRSCALPKNARTIMPGTRCRMSRTYGVERAERVDSSQFNVIGRSASTSERNHERTGTHSLQRSRRAYALRDHQNLAAGTMHGDRIYAINRGKRRG